MFIVHVCCFIQYILSSCLPTFLLYTQPNLSPSVCLKTIDYNTSPMECTTQLNTTLHTIGCCFTALNNTVYGTNTGPCEYMYWTQCGVPTPGACEFDYHTALSRANSILNNNVQTYYYNNCYWAHTLTI